MVSDVTALALGLTDQRLAKPNGEFCKAFLEVTRMLAQIQRWAVVRNNLKWRENVFWLTDSMFHILLAPLLWAWAEEEHHGGESMGRKRLLTSAERQEEGARDKGWPLNTSPVTWGLQTGLRFPLISKNVTTSWPRVMLSCFQVVRACNDGSCGSTKPSPKKRLVK